VPQTASDVEANSMLRRRKNGFGALPETGAGGSICGPFGTPQTMRDGAAMALDLSQDEIAEFEAELSRLKEEHRDLDRAIDALESMVAGDQLQIQRLKKRKLALKDRIAFLEDELTPDIIA
jgi:hypothetical protein